MNTRGRVDVAGFRARPKGLWGTVRLLRIPILTAAAFGFLIAVPLAIWIGLLNEIESLLEFVALAAWLVPLYTVMGAVVLVGMCVLLLILGIQPTPRICIALSLSWYVFLNGIIRYITSVQFASVVPHLSLIGVVDGIAVVTATVSIGWGVARRRAVVGVGAAALLIAGLEILHQIHEPQVLRDLSPLASEVSSRRDPSEVFALAPERDQLTNVKLAILAIDGLSWEVLVPLLDRGKCPNFRALLEGSAFGHLQTLFYPRSPVLWESISTGRTPMAHGIGDHSHFDFPGIDGEIRQLPHFRLANSVMGLNRLLVATSRFAPWAKVPASSLDARSARFWEIANQSGYSVGIYNWYNTTPVAPVRGFIRGRFGFPPTVFPLDLEEGLPDLDKPKAETGIGWVEETIPWERAHFERFLAFSKRFTPDLVAFYTHFADGINHLNWKSAAHGDRFLISGIAKPALGSAPAITRGMDFVDTLLGEYMRVLPQDATLVVVSDHGFDFRGYEHDNSPAGVLIVRGPEIRPGVFSGASLYDVAPTLLQLLEIPAAQDMDGAPLSIGRKGVAFNRELARVSTYGPAAEPLETGQTGEEELREHEEYLRALGYVN